MISNEYGNVDFSTTLPDVDGMIEDVESQHPVLGNLKMMLASANVKLKLEEECSDRYRIRLARHRDNNQALKTLLTKLVEDNELDDDVAISIAEVVGIELSKTVELTLSYQVSVVIEVPLTSKYSLEDIADCVQLDAIDYQGYGELISSEVDLIDYTEAS